MRGDPRYDDLVAAERVADAMPGPEHGTAEYDERVRVVAIQRDLYEDLMWEQATTPEELLAAHIAGQASMRLVDQRDGDWWAIVRWPWGDARGRLKVKGRTYHEAQLRLRDRLVESARKLVVE